jgi:hypothetical protein
MAKLDIQNQQLQFELEQGGLELMAMQRVGLQV